VPTDRLAPCVFVKVWVFTDGNLDRSGALIQCPGMSLRLLKFSGGSVDDYAI